MSSSTGAPPRAGKREWIGLAVLALPTLLVSLDTFVMVLALPRLAAGLHADNTQQLWIMDIYGFMVAGFMITMGTVGDRIGRRRLVLAGAAVFGTASILAAYANSPTMLIGIRAVLGVAGAALTPSILALITNMFRDPGQRARAIGIWAGCFTVGAVIGPVVGGALLDRFWWGSVFLLGVPAMILLLVLGPVLLPEYRNATAGRLDVPSVALSLAAILPVIGGLKELAQNGWHARPVGLVVVGLAVGAVFVRRQRRLADPLLDLRLFADRAFASLLGSMLGYSMLGGGTMVFIAQTFQSVDGLSPLRSGLALVPGMCGAMISFQVAPVLGRRIRPGVLLPASLLLSIAGLLLMTQVGTSGAALLIVGFAVNSLGTGPLVTLGTNLIVGSAPPERAGSAAALAQTGNEFGYALGIAALGSVMAAVYRSDAAAGLPAGAPASARDTLLDAMRAADGLPGQLGAAVRAAAQQAFVHGLHTIALISAALLAGIAVLLAATLRRVPAMGQSPAQTEESARIEEPEPAVLAG
ncbi:MFS transporter [Rugosimonospora africana]|uniref:MFS transporter n=1 Tax=Rugosimonospora africana TaxID=556532 RepID=A0A8J3VSY6_9ACTN|nr:MFS transporter [Rugosimonospora africana]GIH16963.1 MFS transporter [Rugosimonospora africana]